MDTHPVDPIALIENREQVGKRPGGFGIYLARKVMDSISYNEKGNCVVMVKRFPVKTGEKKSADSMDHKTE